MTQEELKFALTKLAIYEGFFSKFMHAKPEQFENLQRKAIEIGTQLGLPYSGEANDEFQENMIYATNAGNILITGKRTDEDGALRYNIAKIDQDKNIIPDSRKMNVSHEELVGDVALLYEQSA